MGPVFSGPCFHSCMKDQGTEPPCRTGYKVMRCFPHSSFTAQSRITSRRRSRDPSSRPSSLAPCSPPSRRGLATVELAAPAQRRPALTAAARGAPAGSRSGRRNALGRTKKLTRRHPSRCTRSPLPCLPLDFPSPIQGWVERAFFRARYPSSLHEHSRRDGYRYEGASALIGSTHPTHQSRSSRSISARTAGPRSARASA